MTLDRLKEFFRPGPRPSTSPDRIGPTYATRCVPESLYLHGESLPLHIVVDGDEYELRERPGGLQFVEIPGGESDGEQ